MADLEATWQGPARPNDVRKVLLMYNQQLIEPFAGDGNPYECSETCHTQVSCLCTGVASAGWSCVQSVTLVCSLSVHLQLWPRPTAGSTLMAVAATQAPGTRVQPRTA
jgi:hypothetical protein